MTMIGTVIKDAMKVISDARKMIGIAISIGRKIEDVRMMRVAIIMMRKRGAGRSPGLATRRLLLNMSVKNWA
jgi:hypothetical protein